MKNSKKAFSLIELLIVITIIGILAVAFLPSITSGPSRARDVQRVADLHDLSLAVEMYYQDNGEYPDLDDDETPIPPVAIASYLSSGIPTDPSGRGIGDLETYYYKKCDDGGYMLAANPENVKTTTGYFKKKSGSLCSLTDDNKPNNTNDPHADDDVDENIYVIGK